ncbi:MAG: BCD family MFS transporter [Anaerolineales bacterium]|nr:BCD family MFS transporter [Anaerolineales bacterium]
MLKRFQLGLIHVAVAMTLVPINSTLNRVMIHELAISAALVALLASLPYLFSPLQMIIGSFSDRHPLFGLRRTPYILLGLLLCVGGVVVSPWAAYRLAGGGLDGVLAGWLPFLAWGMGYNLASVSYLALASELTGEQGRGRTIAVMWFMMITSIIFTAIAISRMVDPYTPQALRNAFSAVGAMALLLGVLGLLGLENRATATMATAKREPSFSEIVVAISKNDVAIRFFIYLLLLLAAILGQDVLLEPFAAEAFGWTVAETTRLTSLWGGFVLLAIILAVGLERRFSRRFVAQLGNLTAFTGFLLILIGGGLRQSGVFYLGVIALGSGTGLSTVSNLALMFDMTLPGQVGLFIGAWGVSNALSRLLGSLLGGAVRDIVKDLSDNSILGYVTVFALEAGMLLIAVFLLTRIDVTAFQKRARDLSPVERAALAVE